MISTREKAFSIANCQLAILPKRGRAGFPEFREMGTGKL
jgi:hypothetical protein